MNDKDFDQRIRASRPNLPRRYEALDTSTELAMHAIMDAPPQAATRIRAVPSPHNRRRPLYLSAAAAVIVLVVLTITLVAVPRGTTTWAATPPALEPKPIDGTPEDLLMRLSESIREASEPSAQTVRSQTWALAFTPDDDEVPVVIIPEVREFTRNPDGSVVIDVRAGIPYDASGNEVPVADVEPGSVIWHDELEPGTHVFLYPEPAPTNAADFATYFAASNPFDGPPTAGDYFLATRLLLDEQSLSAEQEAALVQFLSTVPDVTVDGEVVDRLGRTGIVFTTETRTPGQFRDTLVISPDLGILSYEVTYLADDRTDIKAPAVIDYGAWE